VLELSADAIGTLRFLHAVSVSLHYRFGEFLHFEPVGSADDSIGGRSSVYNCDKPERH
jgi:hypothetical protein